MTVSMLRGERGFQAKEIDKLLEWLRSEPRFDVINLPYALLLGLAGPLRRELKAPICCTLQGEDLFLDGLGAVESQPVDVADPRGDGSRRRFLPVSEYYRDFMTGYLGIPREKMRSCRSGSTWTATACGRRCASRRSRSAIFARIAPEKGLHTLAEAYRVLRERTKENRPASSPPATCRRSISPISTRSAARCGNGGSRRSSSTRRGGSRQKIGVPAIAGRVLGADDLRRAEGHVPARSDGERVPVVQPRRGAFPRSWRGQAAADRRARRSDALADAFLCALANPDRARRWAARARRACASTMTSRRRMAEAAESAYESVRSLMAEHADRRPRFEELSHAARRSADPRRRVASLERGDAVAIMGPSGSGKSTLLYILGALDPPTSGTVTLDGTIRTLGEREQAAFRNERIGFVFQDHSLLPQCSVLENVLARRSSPRRGAPGPPDAGGRARCSPRSGSRDRLDHRPAELSGGEKQRAAWRAR